MTCVRFGGGPFPGDVDDVNEAREHAVEQHYEAEEEQADAEEERYEEWTDVAFTQAEHLAGNPAGAGVAWVRSLCPD